MASASSIVSVRESFKFPATFTVTSQNPDPTSKSYTVVFSNRTWNTDRFNPQGTSASVAEQQKGSSSAKQRITTITVNNIFRLNWVNAIKSERRNFSFLTGSEQLSTLEEVITGRRTINIDLGNPAELVLSTLKPRTEIHPTITRFISESLASFATSSAADVSASASAQTATASSSSLATDDTTLKQQGAETRSATDVLSSLSLVDTPSLPGVSSTDKDGSASASAQTATASSSSLVSGDTTLGQQGAETRPATYDLLDSAASTMLPPRRQPSVDSNGDEAFVTPTESPSHEQEGAASSFDLPGTVSSSTTAFVPPPPPQNSAADSSGCGTGQFPATPAEAAVGNDNGLDNLPPPPADEDEEDNTKS